MPDVLTIRLMKAKAWLKLRRREEKKLLISEAKELEAGPQALMVANRTLKERQRNRAARQAMVGAQTIQDRHGHPHILLLPGNLEPAGLLVGDDYMVKTLAHELVHGAQHAASRGRMFTLQDTPFLQVHRTQNRHWRSSRKAMPSGRTSRSPPAFWATRCHSARMKNTPQRNIWKCFARSRDAKKHCRCISMEPAR
jgi:hypothetical protein